MDLQLSGKRALVTGGSRGIGFAVADRLAAEGVDVVITARDQATLDAAAARLAAHGTRVGALVFDTRDDVSVQAMVVKAVDQLGGVDILVNSAAQPAGAPGPKNIESLEDDGIREELETKVLGYLRAARAVVPHMKAQGWGRIISISGLAARQTGSTVGSIRNVAVAAMTKNLADELGEFGINVTVVHPGTTETERMPGLLDALAAVQGGTAEQARERLAAHNSIGRLVTAEEVADVVAFLASPRSVAINGDAIAVGGGARGYISY